MFYHIIITKILIIKKILNETSGQALDMNNAKLYLFWDRGSSDLSKYIYLLEQAYLPRDFEIYMYTI